MAAGNNIRPGHGELDLPLDADGNTGEPFVDGLVQWTREQMAGLGSAGIVEAEDLGDETLLHIRQADGEVTQTTVPNEPLRS